MLVKPITLASNGGTGAGQDQYWPGGDGVFTAEATFGGGNVKLQTKTLNGTWVDVASSTLSANGTLVFSLGAGPIRSFSTTATAVYASATPKHSVE